MWCAVKGCSNDSMKKNACGEITFHAVPTRVKLKEKWLKIIDTGKGNDKLNVCSLHFNYDDFLASGELRCDAVPELLQVCGICLAVGNKLYDMNYSGLGEAYKELTGIMFQSTSIPCKLCWECAHRVLSSSRLRAKALRTHRLLMEVATSQQYVGTDIILNIDRHKHNLTSTLTNNAGFHMTIQENDTCLDSNCETDLDTHKHNVNDLHITLKEEDQSLDNVSEMDLDTYKHNSDDLHITIKEENLSLPSNSKVDIDIDIKEIDDGIRDVNDIVVHVSDSEGEVNDELANVSISEDSDIDDDHVEYEIVSEHSDGEKPVSEELIIETTNVIIVPAEFKRKYKVSKKEKLKKVSKRRLKMQQSDSELRKIFNFAILSLEEQYQEIEKRKESANFLKGLHKCMLCFKGFTDSATYSNHMDKHSDKAGILECDICKLRFRLKRRLREHIIYHRDRFSCKKCPLVTSRRAVARVHSEFHKGSVYSCPQCDAQFGHLSTCLSHVRIRHPSEFVCELCGYSFISQKGVTVHKNFKHRSDEQTVPPDAPLCETCGIRFLNDEALKRHLSMSSKHTQEPRTPARPPASNPQKRKHRRTRPLPNGPITCKQCGLELSSVTLYREHVRSEHPYTIRIRNRNQPPRMCEVCGEIVKYKSLKRHVRAHRHTCPECGKQLSSRGNLLRHIQTHNTTKPFKCEHCDSAFKQKPDLQQHTNFVHLKKPWPKRNRPVKRKRKASDDEDE